MNAKEKVQYMRIALAIQHIGLKEVDVDKVITTYEMVMQKKGAMSLRDIVGLEMKVEKRHLPKLGFNSRAEA